MSEIELGRRMFLGWTPSKERVYVTVRLERQAGTFQTIDHQTVDGVDRLSFTGEVYSGRSGFSDRQCRSAGQCRSSARAVLAGRLAPGVSEDDVRLLVDAWKRWHLNDMQAACAHVKPVGADVSERLDQTPTCPESGYRYGTAWLVEAVPTETVDQLRQVCEHLSQ